MCSTKHEEGDVTLGFDRAGAGFRAALDRFGRMPLPPYIKRPPQGDPRDQRDYQTMFARQRRRGRRPDRRAAFHPAPRRRARMPPASSAVTVTLHVGAGTFLPVKVADTADHRMHERARYRYGRCRRPPQCRSRARRPHRRRRHHQPAGCSKAPPASTAASRPSPARPSLFITPGYRFRAVDLLFTNFHLPRSTLFMLVAAFAGLERMKRAYAHAVAANYRFFSYGDACLIAPARAVS